MLWQRFNALLNLKETNYYVLNQGMNYYFITDHEY